MNNLRTAVSVFKDLEARRYESSDPEWIPPAFEVRLDADINRDDERYYRVRVNGGNWSSRDDTKFVFELAEKHDLKVEIQNSGIELV